MKHREEVLIQRANEIARETVVDLLHVIMYGAQIRTLQNGEPCYYRPPEDIEGWVWPLIEDPPIEPVRRLKKVDLIKAIARTLQRGVSEKQVCNYAVKAHKEKSSIARIIDELDNIVPL